MFVGITSKALHLLKFERFQNVKVVISILNDSIIHVFLQDVFFLKKKRWQTAILANVGFIIAFGIRCNFGAAKGRMISNFTDPFGNNHV